MSKRAPTRPAPAEPAPPRKAPGPRGRGSGKKPFPLMPVAAGVVAFLAALAVGIGAMDGGDEAGEAGEEAVAQVQPVEISGAALPPYAAQGADAAVGTAAPEVRGTGFDGEPVAIARDGRPKLVAFLAHWCPHCQAEVPVVVDWLDGDPPAGVDLVGVSTSVDEARPNYPPSAWLAREGWAFPTIADSEGSEAAQAYGLTGFPYFVAVDGDGNVAARASGEQTVAQLEALVEAARG